MSLHRHHYGDPAGAPLLAVHGITAHGARFRRLAEEALPDRATVAVDLRGHGRSPAEPPWSTGQHVADLLATLDDLGWETCDVLGHSYGALLALELLAVAPERLRRLVLLDPALALSRADALGAARGVLAATGFATEEEAAVTRSNGLIGVEEGGVHPAVPEEIAAHLVRGDDGRFRWRFEPAAVVTIWGEICRPLPTLPVPRPTLVVAAARATLVDERGLALLRERLGASLEVAWVDAGHMVYWDRFPETAELVRGALGGHEARSAR